MPKWMEVVMYIFLFPLWCGVYCCGQIPSTTATATAFPFLIPQFLGKKTMAWNFQWLKCLSFYHRDIAILKFWKHYKNRQKGWPWALEPSTMIAFQSLLSMWQPCLGMIWYFLWILVLKVWKQLWNWQESGVMKRKRSPTMRYNYENHVS